MRIGPLERGAEDAVQAANELDPSLHLSMADFKPYASRMQTNNVWGEYAKLKWR